MSDNEVKDLLHRFIFDKAPVRGEFVQLHDTWKDALDKHDYPPVVRQVLGECMAATALLSATIKFLGKITLQIQGDGSIPMLVVQVNTDKKLRGMASYEGDDLQPGLSNLFGDDARLMITIEMDESSERYQGVVELGNESIAAALEEYFRSSEQLKTRLWLSCTEEVAAGFLLQEMPKESMPEAEDDEWTRLSILAATLTAEELVSLTIKEILHRLYHEDDVRLFSPDQVEFFCNCTRQRIEKTLKTLGEEEVRDILQEQGSVSVDCNFCNHHYSFDAIDVETMFVAGFSIETTDTRH